jgi:predicted enzyme related to lactoylglutathione lyase
MYLLTKKERNGDAVMEQKESPVSMGALCIDSGNSSILADFYAKLLNWEKFFDNGEGAAIMSPDKTRIMGFQTVEDYTPPVWPWQTGKQSQMMHLDLNVEDMSAAVAYALECGATLATTQFDPDVYKTMLDPAGHPFCLCPIG